MFAVYKQSNGLKSPFVCSVSITVSSYYISSISTFLFDRRPQRQPKFLFLSTLIHHAMSAQLLPSYIIFFFVFVIYPL